MKESFKQSIVYFLTLSILLFLALLFLIWIFPNQCLFNNKYMMSSKILDEPHDYAIIKKYIAQGKILPANEITNSVIGYYNSLITFLVALLGISAVSAYFYIKGTTDDKVEEKVSLGVKRYFESQQFKSEMVKCVNDEFKDRLNALDDLQNAVEAITQMYPIDAELNETEEGKNGYNKD